MMTRAVPAMNRLMRVRRGNENSYMKKTGSSVIMRNHGRSFIAAYR